jgi:Neprosin
MKTGKGVVERLASGGAAVVMAGLFVCASAAPVGTDTGKQTEETRKGAEKTTTLGAEELEARRTRILRYFEQRRAHYQVVATTHTKSGQVIDWIKPESQLRRGAIAAPPKESLSHAPKEHVDNPYLETELPKALRARARNEARAATELQLDPSARGPKGTVPVVRFDIERYVRTAKYLPDDPTRLRPKKPAPAPDSNDRYYAVWRYSGDVFGTLGRINIWDTSGPSSGDTSIAQTAVHEGQFQSIEAGKIEWAGDGGAAKFFTFFNTNNYATGDWIGGYDTDVDGWVQVSGAVAPGMSLASWNSTTGGNQYSLDVEVRLWEGNWWIRAAGEWVGYYPNCKGGDAPPCDQGTLFAESGIRDKATQIDWYGEIFDSTAPTPTSTDMGSGAFANTHWQNAAYFRNLLYVWAPATAWWFESGSIDTTDDACYTADGPFYSSDPNWRNWFYYGGPGKEARGCR